MTARLFRMALSAVVLCGACAVAETRGPASPPAKFDVQAYLTPTDRLFIHRADTPQVAVWEWSRDGKKLNAWPGDDLKPPADAALLHIRIFTFPTATIREIDYPPENGPTGPSKEDVISYLISGHMIQTVGDKSGDLRPGDASFHSNGIPQTKKVLEPSSLVSFVIPRSGPPAPEDTIFIAKSSAPEKQLAWWMNPDGKPGYFFEPNLDKAPPGATRYSNRDFDFPRFPMAEAHFPKGSATKQHGEAGDGLIYVLKGKVRMWVGEATDVLVTGDVMREPAWVPHHYEALEDTVILRIAAPAADGSKTGP